MTRIPAGPATKGSQYWLQRLVGEAPSALQPVGMPPLEWLSPRADDEQAEYRDGSMLARFGHDALVPRLAEFWPRGGPVWDGLARASDTCVLVEAKSHVPEFLSPPSAASAESSKAKITRALERTQQALGADARSDWSRVFFQYANRLAHLWWLREQGVDAKLLLVSFVGDTEMRGPDSAEAWSAAFLAADHALGLPRKHALSRHVLHVHPDVRQWA